MSGWRKDLPLHGVGCLSFIILNSIQEKKKENKIKETYLQEHCSFSILAILDLREDQFSSTCL